eukprot:14102-Heterococcus_DN1.PRE.3
MKNVPPAPRRPANRENTLAGVSVGTRWSNQMRVAITSIVPRAPARVSSGQSRASTGLPVTPQQLRAAVVTMHAAQLAHISSTVCCSCCDERCQLTRALTLRRNTALQLSSDTLHCAEALHSSSWQRTLCYQLEAVCWLPTTIEYAHSASAHIAATAERCSVLKVSLPAVPCQCSGTHIIDTSYLLHYSSQQEKQE